MRLSSSRRRESASIVCHSASRIFYRNALNSGLPIFEIGKEVEKIQMGDRVRVNVKTGEIKNLTTGAEIKAKGLTRFYHGDSRVWRNQPIYPEQEK